MQLDKKEEIKTVDAKGLNCPLPILRTRQAIMDLDDICIIRVLATDPDSKSDFPIFCEQLGYQLLKVEKQDNVFEFLINLKPKEG